jgi:hypothetical protein
MSIPSEHGIVEPTQLDPCGCCETGVEKPAIHNPPGQPELDYRIGIHASFLRRMLARLPRQTIPGGEHAGQRPLKGLSTRAGDDASIALLDAWATVGDVLTFYQERIANEGYLRTATERRSILELARSIGYELNPGVAAGAFLAFTVDEGESTPDETTIAAGTQVQSIPQEEGELPQTFETMNEFEAKAWWNALRPQLSEPQEATLASESLFLQGSNLDLEPGDRLLLLETSDDTVAAGVRRRIRTVERDVENDRSFVTFEPEEAGATLSGAGSVASPALVAALQAAPATAKQTEGAKTLKAMDFGGAFNAGQADLLLSSELSESQFQAILKSSRWQGSDLRAYAGKKQKPAGSGEIEVHVLREKTPIFGHNAPHYKSLTKEVNGAFHDWDNPDWEIWKDSVKQNNTAGATGSFKTLSAAKAAQSAMSSPVAEYSDADLYLARPLEGIIAQSWLLLERPGGYRIYPIDKVVSGSLAGFAMSAEATGLILGALPGDPAGAAKESAFKVRTTTAYVRSEALTLARTPLTADLQQGSTTLTLDSLVLDLQTGQPVALIGEQADAEGVERSEIKLLETITHHENQTTLTFSEGLKYSYRRQTVTLNANVVRATHGESVVGEVLGSGDGAQANQRFRLKKPPLAHVSANTPSGAQSTLTVRVNGVRWQEVASLYPLDGTARAYTVRIDDEGNANVIFGNGKRGARLPTDQENVTASYRSGIGSAGEVVAESLSLLKKRPFGVRSVTNPLPASGAGDPETLDDARQNAPLTILALERIVSLQDFEDFARAFAGIGKAQAVALWHGESELVHITVAGADGGEIDETSDLFVNLRDAIHGARDPLRPVMLSSYQPRIFDVKARLLVDEDYAWEAVKSQARDALVSAFSFQARAFGQFVTAAEIVNILHGVKGVEAVDLDKLYVVDASGNPEGELFSAVLPARTARPNPDSKAAVEGADPTQRRRFLPAELLLINPFGITLG